MTNAPRSAGSVCPNTCAMLICRRSAKLVLSGCCMQVNVGGLVGGCSFPRPPLHVEDPVSPTGGADHPFSLAGVADPKGPPADTAYGHRGTVARAGRGLASRI